jgi:uncharacterized protein YjiS (DUF1127 family)
MPPHPTNVSSETGREAAGRRVDRSIASVKGMMDSALAAARADPTVAVPHDLVSAKQAAGPPAASTRSVLGWLQQYWLAFQDGRQRARGRASLHHMSDRELMDIGVTRAEIDYIAAHQTHGSLRDGAMDRSAM